MRLSHLRMNARSGLIGIVAGLALLISNADLALAADSVVLQWNQEILNAIRSTRTPPPIAARAFAIIHTAMFDAWVPYDAVAQGTRLGGMLRRPVRPARS